MVRRAASALKNALPYVADAGAAAYAAIALFALAVAAAEFTNPGSASGAVAPQTLVVLLAAAGAFALVDVRGGRPGRKRLAFFAALGLVAAAVAFWSAWDYFGPVPALRGRLAAYTAAVVGLLFAASASPAPEDV
ncbi:MAG TPA: hypothetical protein VL426_06660 [Candidatus Binatia bacterium]|jgi:hypothetical protein|nr:hypothetical protein [Candidatus Binatia bacterium]